MKPLTPEAAGRELAKVLRLAAQKEEQLKDVTKERKGEIARLMKRARELQGIVLGDAQQVELDTEPADDGKPAKHWSETDEQPRGRPSKTKERQAGAAARASAAAYAKSQHPMAGWLAELAASPDGPLFAPGKWWPELNGAKLAHRPDGTKCPKSGGDWRGCATCTAAVSIGEATP